CRARFFEIGNPYQMARRVVAEALYVSARRRQWSGCCRDRSGSLAGHSRWQRCGEYKRRAGICMEARRPPATAGASLVEYEVLLAGKKRVVELSRADDGWIISLDGQALEASVAEVAPNTFSVLLNGESHQIRIAPRADGTLTL